MADSGGTQGGYGYGGVGTTGGFDSGGQSTGAGTKAVGGGYGGGGRQAGTLTDALNGYDNDRATQAALENVNGKHGTHDGPIGSLENGNPNYTRQQQRDAVLNSDDMSSSVKAYLLNKTGMSYLETAANTNPFSALVTSYDGAQAMDSALTVGKIALSFLNPGLSALVTGLDIAQDAVNGKLGWNTLGKVASVVPGNGLVNGIAKTGLTIGGQLGSGDTQGASGTVGNFTGSLLGSLTGTPLGGPIGGWVGTQIGRGIADGGSDGSASSGGNRGGYGSGNGALVVNTPARPATSATSATTVPNSVTAYQLASASNFMG